jgi:cobaltochelatase CobS
LFATANTIGLGDTTGLYHGTQQINQGQMDRWNIVTTLNYLEAQKEEAIILAKCEFLKNTEGKQIIKNMVQVANLTRNGFANGDISTVMSPRTVLTWADNYKIFSDLKHSFKVSFLNKCDELERPIIAEYYQRCFGEDLTSSKSNVE